MSAGTATGRTPKTRSSKRKPAKKNVLPAEAMHRHAGEAIALLKAVASHNRLLLLCQLVEGERSVGELAQALELSQSVVSQHLGLLRRDGVVSGRREAQSIYYRISDERAHALVAMLFDLFCPTEE